jgi:hypothetical protein
VSDCHFLHGGLAKPAPVVRLAKPVPVPESDALEPGITVRELVPEELPYQLWNDFLSPAEISFQQVVKPLGWVGLIICPQASLSSLYYVPRSDYSQA